MSPRSEPPATFAVKILDFGLVLAQGDLGHLTQSGAIVGTPAYMSPEQASGKPVDPRSDLFSLGCVLYRLCTSQMPFKGAETFALLSALALDTPPAPISLNPEVPAELSELVMQLLSKKPAQRPKSALEVAKRSRRSASNRPHRLLRSRPFRESRLAEHGGRGPGWPGAA